MLLDGALNGIRRTFNSVIAAVISLKWQYSNNLALPRTGAAERPLKIDTLTDGVFMSHLRDSSVSMLSNTKIDKLLFCRCCNTRPIRHLQTCHQDVLAVFRAENRRLPLLYVEPILAQRIEDVRLVGNENGVRTRLWGYCQQLAKRIRAAMFLVRRYHEPALGQVGSLLDVYETSNRRSFVCTVKFAGIDLTDWNSGLMQRLAKSSR